ncbi:MAG: hypothetical protein OSB09_10310 [Planctomycetota bacterium]|nr:hypothetical protein [Planctomycetota bacterium]
MNRDVRPGFSEWIHRVLPLGVLLVISLGVMPSIVEAQGEGRGPGGTDLRLFEFTKIEAIKQGKSQNYNLLIEAKTPKIPVGTKIDLLLTWRSQLIQTFTITVPANRRLREELKLKPLEPTADKYMFRTVIDPKKQSSKVTKALEKEAELFPVVAAPWTEFHFDHQFIIGTAEEIEAALQQTREWFTVRYTEMATLDGQVRNGVLGVEAATDYVNSKGEFDEKKWRDFMDKKVIGRLVELQEEIRKGFQEPRFVAHRLALSYLLELSVAVGKRSTTESKKLYIAQGLAASVSDTKPKKLEVKVRSGRRIPRSSDLNDLVMKINKMIGLAPAEEENQG